MRKHWFLGAALCVAFVLPAFAEDAASTEKAKSTTELKSDIDRGSYTIGVQLGRDLKGNGVPLNIDMLAAALRDVYTDKTPALNDDEMNEALTKLQELIMNAGAEEAERFLVENAKKEGVKTLPSGLQYKVLKSGDGPSPGAKDVAKVNYVGSLIDGTEFDSSEKHGGPADIPVNRVIPGWTEALQLMKVGDKWELYIGPELGYGKRGSPPVIRPNSTLVFQVELLGISPAEPEVAPPTN